MVNNQSSKSYSGSYLIRYIKNLCCKLGLGIISTFIRQNQTILGHCVALLLKRPSKVNATTRNTQQQLVSSRSSVRVSQFWTWAQIQPFGNSHTWLPPSMNFLSKLTLNHFVNFNFEYSITSIKSHLLQSLSMCRNHEDMC